MEASVVDRDSVRQNPASTIVEASIFTNVLDDLLNAIKLVCQKVETHHNNNDVDFKEVFSDICVLCDESLNINKIVYHKYLKCASYVKTGAIRIAYNENKLIKDAIKYGETESLPSAMPHYDIRMMKAQTLIHNSIQKYTTSENSYNPISSHQRDSAETIANTNDSTIHRTSTTPTHSTTTTTQENTISTSAQTTTSTLNASYSNAIHIPMFSIPKPSPKCLYYTPLQAIHIIINNTTQSPRKIFDLGVNSMNQFRIRNVTANLLITIMINKCYVPINKTSMYRLLNQYHKNGGKRKCKLWRDSCRPGPKIHLSPKTLLQLLENYRESHVGGLSGSRSDMKETLSSVIKKDWTERHNLPYSRCKVPEATLRKYVNEVVMLPDFNVMNRVSNKTEARYTAEYSIRSTICFLMIVLTTHFFMQILLHYI